MCLCVNSQRYHWRAGHKQACAEATQQHPVAVNDAEELRESETECPVCLDAFDKPAVKLPCSHPMRCDCLKQVRESNVGTVCPVCRAKLPPGPETFFSEGCTMQVRANRAPAGPMKTRLLQRAVELFQAAAAQGYAQAQLQLGSCYENGQGVEQNMQQAFELHQSAAAQGYAPAQYNLAACYEGGEGVQKNMQRAVELYQLAADQGYAPAQYNLAPCYEDGEGVKKNMQRAIELYQLAADQGYAQAQYNLAGCYEDGEGVKKNMQRAMKLYELAAAQGCAPAHKSLELFLIKK